MLCVQVKREAHTQHRHFNRQYNALLATTKQKHTMKNPALQIALQDALLVT